MRRAFSLLAAFSVITPVLMVNVQSNHVFGQNANGTVTRAEAVARIVESHPDLKPRIAWHQKYSSPLPLFRDTPEDAWYIPYLETAFEAGLIGGTIEKTFLPNQSLKVEEAMTIAVRMHTSVEKDAPVILVSPTRTNWVEATMMRADALDIQRPQKPLGSAITLAELETMLAKSRSENLSTVALSIRPQQNTAPVIAQQPQQPVVSQSDRLQGIVPVARPQQTVTTSTSQPRQVAQTGSSDVSAAELEAARQRAAEYRAQQAAQSQNQRTLSRLPVQSDRTVASNTTDVAHQRFTVSMPSLGISDLNISRPTNPFSSQGLLAPLQRGVGHLFAPPGAGGKILIYGHSSSYPWDVSQYTKIFRRINELEPGDKVYVTYEGEQYTYEVTREETVPANDINAYRGDGEELILYTCWPPDSIKERYLVRARPV